MQLPIYELAEPFLKLGTEGLRNESREPVMLRALPRDSPVGLEKHDTDSLEGHLDGLEPVYAVTSVDSVLAETSDLERTHPISGLLFLRTPETDTNPPTLAIICAQLPSCDYIAKS